MLKQKSSRVTMAVLLVAAVMIVAAGTAIASNMGFKLNKGLVPPGAGQIGNNWTSIPFFNPYGTFNGFCTATGLPSAGLASARTSLTDFDPSTGNFTTGTCGSSTRTITPGWGLRIRGGTTAIPGGSIIIVGSHNPSLSISVPAVGAGQIGNYWLSVPYHTTAVTVQDFCNQAGMVSTGLASGRGTVITQDAASGNFRAGTCGGTGSTTALVLGEAARLRQPPNGITFIPSHF